MTNSQLILPAILVPFLAWRYYCRFKRLIGRQLFQKSSLLFFGLFMVVVTLLGALYAGQNLRLLGGLAGGVASGVLLSFIGLKLTRFETLQEGKFYTPNAWLGISVLLLFAGRLVYRYVVLYASFDPANPPTMAAGQSPLTLFFLGITAGYYACFYLGIVVKFGKDRSNLVTTNKH